MKKLKYILLFLGIILSLQSTIGVGISRKTSESINTESKSDSLFYQILNLESSLEDEPEHCIDQLNEILPLAIKQNANRETGFCYILLGRCYKILQQPTLALQYMKLAKFQFDKKGIQVFFSLKNFNENNQTPKRKYKKKGRFTCAELKQNIIPIGFYIDIAEIYKQLEQYSNSNEMLNILRERVTNNSIHRNLEYFIAQNQFESGKYTAAIEDYKKLLIHEKHGNQNLNIKNCCRRIADCYYELGDMENVEAFLQLAKVGIDQSVSDSIFDIIQKDELSKSNELNINIVSPEQRHQRHKILKRKNLNSLAYLNLAKKYYKNKEFQKAERALDKYFGKICYALFEELEIQIIRDIANQISKTNRPEKALQYLMHYEALRDTIKNHQVLASNKSSEIGAKGLQNILNADKIQRAKELKDNKYDFLKKEQEFTNNMNNLLLFGLLIVTVGVLFLRRISKQRKVSNQQLALRSLRSQMNPHFIFNALNSVNSFISLNNERDANKFLSEFSSLMRTVMENSEYDFISLTKEIEILNIYLKLEHHRFKDKFTFHLNIDENIDEDHIQLPPMLIQPYLENAIWHGLRYKNEKGFLQINIKEQSNKIIIEIMDDGIGRVKSKLFKTKNQKKNKSIALKNIDQRIEIFQNLHKIKIDVKITDLYTEKEDTGTKIIIIIPQKN